MTTATPPAPYSTMEGALASGFAITQLHHSAGHDPSPGRRYPEPSIKGLRLLVPTRNASIWSSILTSFWLACRKALQFRDECSLPTEFHQIGSVSLQALIPLILLPEPDLPD